MKFIDFLSETTGTYVSVKLSNKSDVELRSILSEFGVNNISDGLHCTIMYSTTVIKNDISNINMTYTATIERVEEWEGHDKTGYLVLILKSPKLKERHQLWKKEGGTPTFDDYVSHITIKNPYRLSTVNVVSLSDTVKGTHISLNRESKEPIK